MQIMHMNADQHEEWNSFVAQGASFSLLQSWEWGEFKEKIGWKAFRIAVKKEGKIIAGAQMLIKSVLQDLASIAYIPRGPLGEWLDPHIAVPLLSELTQIAKRYKVVFLKIEPALLNNLGTDRLLQQYQFRASPYNNQPRATIHLDLTPNLEDILKNIQKKTREKIRHAERTGVIVTTGGREDLSAFYNLMQKTGRRKHFPIRTNAYYKYEWQAFADSKQVILLMALFHKELLAVRTAFCFDKYAASLHSASINKYSNLHSNYLLAWEAIKWAKAKGCNTYDLWGIPNEIGRAFSEGRDLPNSNRTDGLWGVYKFKRGFSKNIIYYLGAYDYVYKPFLYALITNKLFNSNTLERIAVWADRLNVG